MEDFEVQNSIDNSFVTNVRRCFSNLMSRIRSCFTSPSRYVLDDPGSESNQDRLASYVLTHESLYDIKIQDTHSSLKTTSGSEPESKQEDHANHDSSQGSLMDIDSHGYR